MAGGEAAEIIVVMGVVSMQATVRLSSAYIDIRRNRGSLSFSLTDAKLNKHNKVTETS